MTRREKVFELRRKGLTYREIGELCGCSHQSAWNIVNGRKPRGRKTVTEKDCKYPRIRQWMNENGVSVGDIADTLYGRRYGAYATQTRKLLCGGGYLYKDLIDKILSYTSLTYEEAFADG